MPKQPRALRHLLEPGFAEGYDAFKELVDYTGNVSTLPHDQRVWIRLFELVSVAMIEGLNVVENELEAAPALSVAQLWNVAGAALATVNAQAFREEGMLAVRREMIVQFKEGYDRALKASTKGIPEKRP